MISRILIVDDNEEILEIISYHLEKHAFQIVVASTTDEALHAISSYEFDAAILDVMMPDMDGFSLCRKIRNTHFFPILFLTAKENEEDKIEGLNSGADDYMVKPFSSNELVARIESLIRRNTKYSKKHRHSLRRYANLVYDSDSGKILIREQRLDLTDIEYRILLFLIQEEKKPASTEKIYTAIWGDPFTSSSDNNVVVHIKNIRRKISELDGETEYIHTIWGKGYAFYV